MEETHNPDVEITVVHRECCVKGSRLYYDSMKCKTRQMEISRTRNASLSELIVPCPIVYLPYLMGLSIADVL